MANQFATEQGTKDYLNTLVKRRTGATSEQLGKLNNEYQRVYGATYGAGKFGGSGGGSAQLNAAQKLQMSRASANQNGNQTGMNFNPTAFNGKLSSGPSYDEALGQARQQLDPLRTQARVASGVANQQQMDLLRQRLAAGGNLQDSGYGNELGQMATQHQESMNNLDSQYNSQAAAMAQNIQQQGNAQAQQQYQNAFTEWVTKNNQALQAAQNARTLNRDAASDSQFGTATATSLLPYILQTMQQKYQGNIDWTNAMGQVPGQTGQTAAYDPTMIAAIVKALSGAK